MATGFALLSISPLHEKTVFETLKNVPEVTEIHPLFGEYDILVKIECSNIAGIGEVDSIIESLDNYILDGDPCSSFDVDPTTSGFLWGNRVSGAIQCEVVLLYLYGHPRIMLHICS